MHVDEAWDYDDVKENGLYFITRRYIRNGKEKEAPLYVGRTVRSFYKRLKEHFKDNAKWTRAYGRKYISFGRVSMYRIDKYNMVDLLSDIESEIIQDLDNDYPDELLNKQQKNSSSYHYNLYIEHIDNEWLGNY